MADDDGLFAVAGHPLARTASNGVLLFVGAVAVVGAVTAVLNLDTSVAFLTPVLVYTARSRGEGEAPLLYGCLLLSNAGSLFLPGSNLTNLIVVGHLHLNGGQFHYGLKGHLLLRSRTRRPSWLMWSTTPSATRNSAGLDKSTSKTAVRDRSGGTGRSS